MLKPLTPEQCVALRAVPLVPGLPNLVRLALAMTNTQQTDVVAETGLSASDISKAVTGKGVTSIDTARAIARFFDCDIELLFPDPAIEPAGDRRVGDDRRSGEDRREVVA